MPYKIVYRKGDKRPWKIVKTTTGKVVGSSTTRANAVSSMRARYGAEHGWHPTGKRSSRSKGRLKAALRRRTRKRRRRSA